jgi:putative transcriptional regulator
MCGHAYSGVMNALQNHLSACLVEKKINQSQLARRLGKSRSYVSRLMGGEIRPCITIAIRIAHYFGKPVEQIFYLPESQDNQNHFLEQSPDVCPPTLGEPTKQAETTNQR